MTSDKDKTILVFDIEGDGLQDVVTTVWMIVAQNVNTGMIYKFSDHGSLHGSIADGISFLNNADILVGHNIVNYDLPVLDMLFGSNLLDKQLRDTFLMSKVLKYVRSFTKGHGLGDWGEYLGNNKGNFDSSKFTEGDNPEVFKEMLRYCIQDVKVNVRIYEQLMQELRDIKATHPEIMTGLRVEHDTAVFSAKASKTGWNLDVEGATLSREKMTTRLDAISAQLEPKLGSREVVIDKEPKVVKFSASGNYHSASARMLTEVLGFEVKQEDIGLVPAGTSFRRTEQRQIEVGQVKYVKEWLLANGWKPTEYAKKMVNGRWETGAPKLTEDSLKGVGGGVGDLLGEYLMVRSRRSVIEGWLEKQSEGRIHGSMMVIGTPTFRCTHKNIVNLPAVTAEWGQQVRELLKADEGTVIVGADSAGNQLRALCHYVGNDDFTNEVRFGDQHQRNADALGCSRPLAKNYLYAYLFGAGDAKLGQVLTGKSNASVGRKSRQDFAKGIKGMEELKTKLTNEWRSNGSSFFRGLDGRPVYCASEHQLLNYLLQSAEAITCKASVFYAMRKIKEEGLRAEPRIFYHDEMAYQVHPDDAARVGEILTESFREAPKLFDVQTMDGGDYVMGNSYADVH